MSTAAIIRLLNNKQHLFSALIPEYTVVASMRGWHCWKTEYLINYSKSLSHSNDTLLTKKVVENNIYVWKKNTRNRTWDYMLMAICEDFSCFANARSCSVASRRSCDAAPVTTWVEKLVGERRAFQYAFCFVVMALGSTAAFTLKQRCSFMLM